MLENIQRKSENGIRIFKYESNNESKRLATF